MATKRGLIQSLLILTAIMAALLTTAGAARTASAAQLRTRPNATSPTLSQPRPASTLKGSINVHLYNGLVAGVTGVANAGVTLTASGGLIAAKAVTNSAGDAMLIAAPGVYKLYANASGYQPVHLEVKISGYSSELQIAMTPIPITDPWITLTPTNN
jgi:hypothetical protein